MGRIIGIKHRRKRTADNEARPTLVAIKENGVVRTLELADETAELDFALAKLQTAPDRYEGLKTGDTVVMMLGGSGDRLVFALSRRAEEKLGGGTNVFRVPPFVFKTHRGETSKDDDHVTLIALFERSPELFYLTGPRDRALITVREAYYARQEAQQARMTCGLRLRQRVVGKTFLSLEGGYPEGSIEDRYDAEKATDAIYQALEKEEKNRDAELKRAMHQLEIWDAIFAPIVGCGETIAAGIVSAVGDIRRFEVKADLEHAKTEKEAKIRSNLARKRGAAKLKKFLGVHVLPDGRFPRKRRGEVANWSPRGRQALYQLGQQFNRRPNSVWGQKLRHYKEVLREKHPVVVMDGDKKRYTKGHIHNMATWRTLTKFVESLYRDWLRIETELRNKPDRAQAA